MDNKKLSFKVKMLFFDTFLDYIYDNHIDIYNETVEYLQSLGLTTEVLKK